MELKDTIEMMNSEDYKERFKAEYYQTKIRYDKLDKMTVKYEAGTLNFTPNCSLEVLKKQKKSLLYVIQKVYQLKQKLVQLVEKKTELSVKVKLLTLKNVK